jgi:beta-N-acetylhexosaminidase
MKLRQKIGQLLMAGFEGTRPSKAITRLIKEYQIGGVILFARNIESPTQLAHLTRSLQRLSPEAPLLVAVDQEGGRVSRLPPPFTQFPSARVIGECDSVPLTYSLAEAMAKELRAVGINMNMAPVLDVDTCPKNPIIGDRAFGKSPTLVSKLGLAVIAGLQDNHVIACGKHFPGHGDTTADSHKELPKVNHPLKRLLEIELRPFIHAAENRLASMMTAHVLYKQIDDKFPATLSKKIINRLLRNGIKFDGLVATDDLEMKAISDNYRIEEAALKAVQAGCDLLLVCKSEEAQQATLETLIRGAEKKSIGEARILSALNRILRVKESFLLPFQTIDPKDAKKMVGTDKHRQIVAEVEKRGAKKHG